MEPLSLLSLGHERCGIQLKGDIPTDPDVATSYNNIGSVYNRQGRYKEALQEYEKCLKIQVDKLGHEHLDVAASYNNIGEVYRSLGDSEKALFHHEKALEIRTRVVGLHLREPDHASTKKSERLAAQLSTAKNAAAQCEYNK